MLTSECVNSGAWSFLSVIVMVAVVVPDNPTLLPAMSFATISSSYCVVGRVWEGEGYWLHSAVTCKLQPAN